MDIKKIFSKENKKKAITFAVITAALLVASIVIGKIRAASNAEQIQATYTTPSVGKFEVIITSTGEIAAESSVDIFGPSSSNRQIRISNVEITDLVPEGTEVKAGDYVATLDRTTMENNYKDAQETLESRQQSYELTLLDSAVTLSNQRGTLKTKFYAIESAQIKLDQTTYESPAKVRSAQRTLEKAKSDYEAAKLSYDLTYKKQLQSISQAKERYDDQRQLVADYAKLLDQFVIYAPSDGMVVYYKDRNGQKRKAGSSINQNQNIVAELPDMSTLISTTYVNEIDVNKVKVGQSVILNADAFPGKNYKGEVISVANVGEQLSNADAKVFEVVVRILDTNTELLPSMTTGNKIYTNTQGNVMSIPLGCVQRDENNIPFVYMKSGYKQIVLLGDSNDDSVIVEDGLKANSKIYLETPNNLSKFKRVKGEEFIPIIKEREASKNTAVSLI